MPTAATILLGRDCSISVGGATLTGVRSVTVNQTRTEIEVPLFAGGESYTLPGHRVLSVEIETISQQDAIALQAAMSDTSQGVVISGTNVNATFVVTSFSASEPLDDVVVYTATLKRTFSANA